VPALRCALPVVACLAAACGTSTSAALRKEMPVNAHLVVDVPRREAQGVSERWAVTCANGKAFLVHAADVDRRRTRQTCGMLPPESFVRGWRELRADGLLHSAEDYRLMAPPGSDPFVARLQLAYRDERNEVMARRPLTAAALKPLMRTLRRWETTLQPARLDQIPSELRVEIGMGVCDPKVQPPASRPPPAGAADSP
jgi:hypothetical protein